MTVPLFPIMPIGLGRLGVMAKPNGGEALAQQIESIAAQGATHIASLLEHDEAESLGLKLEPLLAEQKSLRFSSFPIADLTLPSDVDQFIAFAQRLHEACTAGDYVMVHCRAGIGRSGMTASAILMFEGYTADAAIDIVTQARNEPVPDTESQREFIIAMQANIAEKMQAKKRGD